MIAPTFDSLATKFAKPGKIAFCKVDVDSQGEVAQLYGVRAMPTFVILRSGSVIDTIKGANPPALTAAVEKAVKLAGAGGGGAGATFAGSGQRLGGSGVGRQSVVRPARWDLKGFVEGLVAFFGLYFWSLISVSVVCLFGGGVGCGVVGMLTCCSSTLTRRPRTRRSTRGIYRRPRPSQGEVGQGLRLPALASRHWPTWGANEAWHDVGLGSGKLGVLGVLSLAGRIPIYLPIVSC